MTGRAGGEEAASSLVAFIVAGTVFIGSIGAILYTTDQVQGSAVGDGPRTASLHVQANSLASLLLESPGLTTSCTPPAAVCAWSFECSSLDTNVLCSAEARARDQARAESLTRLGLADPADPSRLDFEKFENLRLAPLQETSATADGLVNYREAVEAMGLDEHGLDFHVRSFPNLARVRELLEQGEKDPNLRVAYIGDINEVRSSAPPGSITITQVTCTVSSERPNAYRLTTTVTVPAGTTAAQLEGVFNVKLQATGSTDTRKMNSFALETTASSGQSVEFTASLPFASGRSCANGEASFDLYDVASTRIARKATHTVAGTAQGAQTTAVGLLVDTLAEHYTPTQSIGFSYDGEGLGSGPSEPLFLVVCQGDIGVACPTPVARISFNAKSGNGNNQQREISLAQGQEYDAATSTWGTSDGKLDEGQYTVRLYRGTSAASTATRAEERLLVATATPPPYEVASAPATTGERFRFGDAVAPEVGFLEDLVEKFCPTLWDEDAPNAGIDGSAGTSDDGPLPLGAWNDGARDASLETNYGNRCDFRSSPWGGDVLPMERNILKTALQDRLLLPDTSTPDPNDVKANLAITNVLIVGSNVDHQMLTSNPIKDTVATWVEGGGTLMVFGSADQRLEWLQSVFHIATTDTSSNGIAVPDSSHPVLHTGDDLAYNDYTHNQRTWTFKQNGANADIEDYFTHVVVGDNGDPVLTISDPGAFGGGTVILTTWLPYDLLSGPDDSDCEPPAPSQGCLLMNNMLMQGYRDLFLDYGPVIPASGYDVIPAVRKATLMHPDLGLIPLDVLVYVF